MTKPSNRIATADCIVRLIYRNVDAFHDRRKTDRECLARTRNLWKRATTLGV